MNETTLIFTADGRGCCLYTEAINLSDLGKLTVSRATVIEFDNKAQYWRVLDPDGFPMFNAPSRQECLEWERRYLNANLERLRL